MFDQPLPGRARSRLRRPRFVRFMALVILGFSSTIVTFLLSFYIASDSIVDAISYLLVPQSDQRLVQLSPRDAIKFYQPRDFSGKRHSLNYDYYITYNDFNFREPKTLTYSNRTYTDGTRIVFRFPQKTPIVAVLLIFHSCRRSASQWFHTVERQRIIGAAINLGYACLVFQATDRVSKCWSNNANIYENRDVQMILRGLKNFYEEHTELALLPRFTFGVSSGGIFSSILATNEHYPIHGQVIFASIVLPEVLYNHVKRHKYPPTAWIHMLRDVEFASEHRINASRQIFLGQNVSCIIFPIEPVSLTGTIFHDRIPSVSNDASRYMFYQLQRHRWLNYHNYLLYNPRRKLAWQEFLLPPADSKTASKEIYNNIYAHRYQLFEFLNTAYGEHEISYERSFEALKWLLNVEKHSRKSR